MIGLESPGVSSLEPRLRDAFARAGLPRLIGLEVLRPADQVLHFEARCVDEDGQERSLHAQVLLDDLDGGGLYGAHLAATVLADTLPVPVPRPSLLLPPAEIGVPVFLSAFPPGRNGHALLRARPEVTGEILTALGRAARLLGEIRQDHWGTLPMPLGFQPERLSWREEWLARVARRVTRARALGVALEPLLSQVLGRIEAGVPALDAADRWGLVHEHLVPANTTFDEDLGLVGVLGWERSIAGDPWIAVAVALHLEDDALGAWADGYGRDALVAASTDPAALARLDVYALTEGLTRLVSPGPALAVRARAVERARAGLERALAMPPLERLRVAALPSSGARVRPPIHHPTVDRVRAALDRLVLGPPLHAGQAPLWCAATLTAVFAAGRGAAPDAAGWDSVTDRLLAMLPPATGARTDATGAGWAALVRAVVGHHLAIPELRLRGSLYVLFAAERGFEGVGRAVDPSWFAGLGSLLAGVMHQERRGSSSPVPAAQDLTHALFGLAACRCLEGAYPDLGGSALRARLEAQLAEAWDVLDVGAATPRTTRDEVAVRFASPERHQGLTVPVAPLLVALDTLGAEALPASPGALLAALGLTEPDGEDPWNSGR